MLKISLRLKLVVLTVGLALISGLVGAIAFTSMNEISQIYHHVATVNMPKNEAVGEMLADYRKLRVRLMAIGLDGETAEQAKSEFASGQKAIDHYEASNKKYMQIEYMPGINFGPDEEKLYRSVEENWQKFKKISEKVGTHVASATYEDRRQILDIIRNEIPEVSETFAKHIGVLLDYHKKQSEEWVEKAQSTERRARNWLIGVIASGFLLALLIGVLVSGWIARQLNNVTEKLVATGSQVKVASESLSSASQQLASSSQEQAASVEEVSASLEEISGMVTSSLKGAKDSVDHSKHVTELVIEGAEAMAALQTAVNQIAESNQRVEQLAKLIEEIGAKSELIDEIVFQTRLLSFNASVEAERAGEHGRGFAVVAQEVGNLAQMSGKSAAEIGQIVKSSIKEAQAVSQENRLKVEQGVSICKTTANKLEVIRKASEDILNGSQQILRASEEQSAGVQQINQSIQLISQTTQGNASAAEECADNSRALSDQSVNLENVVTELGRFVSGRSDSKPNNVIEFKKRESEEKGGEVKIQSQSFSGERKKKFSLRSGSTAVAASNDLWEDI